MSDIEGSDAPVVKGFKGKEKEVEGQAKREGKVTVGAMCRRRLAVVLVRLKMAETVKMVSCDTAQQRAGADGDVAQGVTYVEQGHVRVGPDTITDPAFLVTRNMEDFVTWVDTSKLKRHVQKYNVSTTRSVLNSSLTFCCFSGRVGRFRPYGLRRRTRSECT